MFQRLSIFWLCKIKAIQSQQISVKHYLINIMSKKSDNWACEYRRKLWSTRQSTPTQCHDQEVYSMISSTVVGMSEWLYFTFHWGIKC